MSGGSYDYLYTKGDPGWGSASTYIDPDILGSMADRLDQLGFTRAAAETRIVAEMIVADPVEARFPGLREIWHQIEWYDSGDTGHTSMMNRISDSVPHYIEGDHPDPQLNQ